MSNEWRRYRLTWQLASPLHIGDRTIGTIARTRLWVPGRNVWGALIDTLARAQGATPQNPTLFETLQGEVNVGMCFESWFLTPHSADAPPVEPWHPHQEQTGWYYGLATEQQMQRMVLGANVSTAIEHGTGIAEEGMLFETEYLAPRTFHAMCGVERGMPLWLVGHLWIADESQLTWQQRRIAATEVIAQHAQAFSIGGEQTKGYGQLVRGTLTLCLDPPFFMNSQRHIHIPAQTPMPFLVASAKDVQMRGRVEPIVGRTTTNGNNYGATLKTSQPHPNRNTITTPFCWLPGSVSDETIKLQFDPAFPGIATLA